MYWPGAGKPACGMAEFKMVLACGGLSGCDLEEYPVYGVGMPGRQTVDSGGTL